MNTHTYILYACIIHIHKYFMYKYNISLKYICVCVCLYILYKYTQYTYDVNNVLFWMHLIAVNHLTALK